MVTYNYIWPTKQTKLAQLLHNIAAYTIIFTQNMTPFILLCH